MKIQITRDGGTRTWYLNKELLVQKSSKFRDLLNATDTVSLHSDTVEETVETFSAWIFTGNLVIPEPESNSIEPDAKEETHNRDEGIAKQASNSPSSSSTIVKSEDPGERIAFFGMENSKPWFINEDDLNNQVFGRLLDLYLFAVQYEAPALKLEVLMRWQRHAMQSDTFPNTNLVKRLLLALPLDDGLIRWEVANFGYCLAAKGNSNGLGYDCLPAQFLIKLLKFVEQYVGADNDKRKQLHPDRDWCKFHHHSESERKNCRRRRPDDPDIKDVMEEED